MISFQKILDELGMTAYGASQLIGSETDEPIKTIHVRLQRWLNGHPPKVDIFFRDLGILGYEFEIRRKR
jgi:hypothetical protein